MLDEIFSQAQATVLEQHGLTCDERWVETSVVEGRTHVLVAGDGPPVVLLSGIGTPGAMMAPLMAGIDGVARYAVDLPGYGLTDTTADFARNLRSNAVRFLLEVIDGLGLDRPTFVANSLGSLWAAWLAIDHPDRVAGLAHIGCPAIVLDTSAPLPMRLLSVRALGSLLMRLRPPSEKQVEELSKMVGEYPLEPDIARLLLATERLGHFRDAFLITLNRLIRLRGNRPEMAMSADQLSRISVPTLLVFARNDPMGGPAVGRRILDLMPDAELHVVDGGHAPWLRHADQITPRLTTFLGEITARSGN